ncbi:MAG: sulfatase-like hydrolase/transferase [Faecalibacterium sp.]|nr:sulfatase-like hydrolase/transferase [Ruminococcus sp.]MCM1391825.1 sulfatase-like hydrolase/transferase [Ruminococcus sp.]MCM1485471.1 sulfatase-like hydrolase/transferase [Faecalibacterium sp.]
MDKRKNIIFYFSDQQRWDTVNDELTPNLMKLADEGIKYENNFTCQPVCGPARACLQTGVYATQCGCYWNGVALPEDTKPLAEYFNEAGYETAYIGKWHLASDRYPNKGVHCEKTAVPKERQGGYSYWRAADILEFTSHGYDGYIFDGDGNQLDFKGYRADCINDYALEFLENRNEEKPFFMFISQLEPHHQNDHKCYEGFRETVENYRDYPIPDDLSFLKGDYKEQYPDYLSAINRLDYNVGRLVEKLKELGIYEDTVIIYTSDHGSHFKTRNTEYKRSCHESSTHTPLIISGGDFKGGIKDERLTSLIDMPTTLLSIADIDIPDSYEGVDLKKQIGSSDGREHVFIQISESQCGRAIRTKKYKYSVRSAAAEGVSTHSAPVYFEDYLYDLEKDPNEKVNLVKDKAYKQVRAELKQILLKQMTDIGEKKPLILPALFARKK